jgi:hypothetical protein
MARQVSDWLTVKKNITFVRREQASNQSQENRFAAA